MLSLKLFPFIASVLIFAKHSKVECIREYTKQDLNQFKQEVQDVFYHAYNGYLNFAFPYDELRPLSCDGIDTWGSYSLTLIDALDTLAIMKNYTEFNRVVKVVTEKANFDININVSVFETNIRIVGGLLSAHLLSEKAGMDLEPGWPCNGPLLRLAEDVAKRLLPAFDTETGMPYGTVNLRHGVPVGETPVTCTAGVATFIIEFGTLSRLTGDPIYEAVAMNALRALYKRKSRIGLFGNHIDTKTGVWTAQDSGIGAGVDSYFEYLVKGAILFQKPELMKMFNTIRPPIERYLKRDDWYLWVSMHKGQVTLPVFQSLEAFWPGVLSLTGDITAAMKSLHNYHQVWKQYGFLPEFYNVVNSEASANREAYPLRPELIESVMYLFRATGDPYLLDVGVDMLRSIQHSARTPCGFATIKNVLDHSQEDRMESFFLSETTKYLYLLFDTDNFIHDDGLTGKIFHTNTGKVCVLGAGGYIFNTEAHPIDLSALHCCSNEPIGDIDLFQDGNKNVEDSKRSDEVNVEKNSDTENLLEMIEHVSRKNDIEQSEDGIVELDNVQIIEKTTESSDTTNEEVNVNNVLGQLEGNIDKMRQNKVEIKQLIELYQNQKYKFETEDLVKYNKLLEKFQSQNNQVSMLNDELDFLKNVLKNAENLKSTDELKLGKSNNEKVDHIDEKNILKLGESNDDIVKIGEDKSYRFDALDDKANNNSDNSTDGLSELKEVNDKIAENLNDDLLDKLNNVNNAQVNADEENVEPSETSSFTEDMHSAKISVNSNLLETSLEVANDECFGLENESLALCLQNKTSSTNYVFSVQNLFDKIVSNRYNVIDATLVNASFSLLSCTPQPFHTRFTLRGEFFETST